MESLTKRHLAAPQLCWSSNAGRVATAPTTSRSAAVLAGSITGLRPLG
ncbi:hypothetical protein F4556_006539 [Kitasatospora gansuensis]|uniref:Uncharacterized protein n=1 Tax=Kitasatospora gansuensis TaxID=258050 RepID=A0A7W7SIB1_9ACTN|nr:hypothetical protein [Kitasatospora gansuensis]